MFSASSCVGEDAMLSSHACKLFKKTLRSGEVICAVVHVYLGVWRTLQSGVMCPI